MPDDVNGKPLEAGDQVLIRGTVEQVMPRDASYTVRLKIAPLPPNTTPYFMNLNGSQVEKVEPAAAAPAPDEAPKTE